MLGPRVNSLSVGGLVDRIRRALGRPVGEAAAGPRASRWEWIANSVMAHPVVVIVPTLSLLLLAGLPFLRLEQGIPDAYTLPRGPREPRGGRRDPVRLRGRHDRADRRPRRRPGRAHVRGQRPRARRVRREPGRRVRRRARREPVHRHPEPRDRPAADHRRARRAVRPAAIGVAAAARRPCGTGTSTRPPSASTRSARSSRRRPPGTAVVAAARDVDPGAGLTAQIGGQAATGHDFLVSQTDRIPYAVGHRAARDVRRAVPAVRVGRAADQGDPDDAALDLRLVRRDGLDLPGGQPLGPARLHRPGFTIAGNPIIMFSVLFGLSMDYEVLLLSRVQEAYRRQRRQPRGRGRGPVEDGRA